MSCPSFDFPPGKYSRSELLGVLISISSLLNNQAATTSCQVTFESVKRQQNTTANCFHVFTFMGVSLQLEVLCTLLKYKYPREEMAF